LNPEQLLALKQLALTASGGSTGGSSAGSAGHHPYPCREAAGGPCLGPRDQTRWLSLQVRREGEAVRLFTRRGYDWSGRYPAILVTAMQLRATSFTLDGEAVVCGPDGVAIFDAQHRGGTVTEAMLYTFDLLEFDGEDFRALPLSDRKKRLARLLGKRRVGIVLSEHTDYDGATIFRQACRMGLEGIVSKRLSAPYRSGPSKDWIKIKNPDSPAMICARESER
jgi:bifunctional non-homologous end joining protein LigD